MNEEDSIKAYLASNYLVQPDKVSYINEGVTNTNYLVETSDGKYLFKIYNFKSEDQVQFEVNVLEELRRHDFPSPKVISRKDKLNIGVYKKKPSLLYVYIDGGVNKDWDGFMIKKVGKYMGKKHSLLKDFPDRSKSHTFDIDETKKLVREGRSRFAEASFPEYESLLSFVEKNLTGLSLSNDLPKGVTHHDIKHENVILNDKEIAGIIDFDLSYYGVLINDIATTIIWECFDGDEMNMEKAQSFIDGYEEERPLTSVEKDNLCETIHFRLVREVFSSPFDVLPNYIEITKPRSDEFRRRAERFQDAKANIRFSFKGD
ncbi:MAG: phosphotransferase [Candidatus Pacebacteria bacterium]|jgi:homoserine kinase type II|nr:hypothetical protein [bacterium]MDP6527888.1 phosphotransferase [Candidatus Paceibacterota bacterium]MDP6659698.1 phosphotransferase [Candidatus Paceibacterota bacterium]|tara:strand:- start:29593 stop:30543 length:951 start_codon:yes stop_codon:yes gene_type:complete